MSKITGTAWCPLCGPLDLVGNRGECPTCDENAMGPGADDANAALALVKRIKTQIAGEVEVNQEDRYVQVAMVCLLQWIEELERES